MTEAEWLSATNPKPMLESLRGKSSDRKLRLFLVSCCERIEHLLLDARSRSALTCARRAADGRADDSDLNHERIGARAAWSSAIRVVGIRHYGNAEAFDRASRTLSTGIGLIDQLAEADAPVVAAQAVQYAIGHDLDDRALWGAYSAAKALGLAAENDEVQVRECSAQCDLLHDLYGNPSRPVIFDPTWRTSTVLSLAKGMYDSRDFSAMPILADALQDAGCEQEEVLNHCRSGGVHARGCWVVDQILAKE